MQPVRDRFSVQSPFLKVDKPRYHGVEDLARDVASDIERVADRLDGDLEYDLDVLEEDISDYSFQAARDSTERRPRNFHRRQKGGTEVEVAPDLSHGFFQVDVDYRDEDVPVFVPYIDADSAAVVRTPTPGNPSASGEAVSVGEKWPSGDLSVSSVSESLSYYAPFWGILQPRIAAEAVDHDMENGLSEEPYSVRILEDAWNELEERTGDTRLWNDAGNKIYRIASHPPKNPLDHRKGGGKTGNLSQLNSEKEYLLWSKEEDERMIVVKDILDQDRAYPRSKRS
ncbi:MAG: hypothetical protein ABEI07_01365 [Candidatus Nanohaloarchaea archaeon]